MSAFEEQVDGNHYKHMAIQPAVFCEKNKLSHLESNVVKRICRWRKKGGIKDLRKIQHEIEMLIELHFEDVPTECPHGFGEVARKVLNPTATTNDEVTYESKKRQSDAQSGEGDERKTHTSVSPEHERGYTLYATDMAEGRQGAVLPVVPRS
jgi:hypothetical protein